MRRRDMLFLLAGIVSPGAAFASVDSLPAGVLSVDVSVRAQRMTISDADGNVLRVWPVSTARRGKITPRGTYRPYLLSEHHRSSIYNNAPMPNAIFYDGDYAIHGTNHESMLGRPASAGCVRLSVKNSRELFAHVRSHGKGSLVIRIGD